MNDRYPLVSIVATNYNFEKFIPYFMDSVFNQTYKNWELIVVDDCSTDKSFDLLKQYGKRDARILISQNDKNRHISHTINQGLKRVSGKYICLLSCDDALLPEKLRTDVLFMESHDDVGVRYGQLQQINEHNCIQEYTYLPPVPFDQSTLLRRMYLEGNKCLAPGMLIRSDILGLVGDFHPLLRMTQDYEYHIRILFLTKPDFNPLPLTQYRRMSDNSNLSSTNSNSTVNSEYNEAFFVLRNYQRFIQSYSQLVAIFPEVTSFGPEDDKLVPFYLGKIALNSQESYVKAFGVNMLFDFMSIKDNVEYVESTIGFLPKDLMSLLASHHLYHSSRYSNMFMKKLKSKIFRVFRLRRVLILLENSQKEWIRNGTFGVFRRASYALGIPFVNQLIESILRFRKYFSPRYEKIYGRESHIAYVVPSVKLSGGIAIVLNHANRLRERGYSVCILTMSTETHVDWFPNQVPIFSLLDKEWESLNIDTMVATHWSTAFWVDSSGASRHVYFVQSDERRFEPEKKEEIRAITATYRMDMEYMTEAIWIQRWLKEEFGHKAYYVPNGLDPKVFFPSQPIGKRKERIRILLEGSIDSWFKGMRDAYEAVKDIDCDLWIVSSQGKPPVDWRHDRFFENVPIGEMKDIYSSCDIFLKMSYMEGFFGPPMEAMACGCAVVVGKVTGYDEYIIDGENALVVEQGDIKGAKEAVKRLVQDEPLRKRLIEQGRMTAQIWSWDRSIDLLEKVIVGEKPKKYYISTQLNRYNYREESRRLSLIKRTRKYKL